MVLLCLQQRLVAGGAVLNKHLRAHWCPSPGHLATASCMQDPIFLSLRPTKLQRLLGVSTGHAWDTCCGIRALPMGFWWRFRRSAFPRPLHRRPLARLTCSWQTCFSMLRKQFLCLREYYSRPESSDLYSTFTPSGEKLWKLEEGETENFLRECFPIWCHQDCNGVPHHRGTH